MYITINQDNEGNIFWEIFTSIGKGAGGCA